MLTLIRTLYYIYQPSININQITLPYNGFRNRNLYQHYECEHVGAKEWKSTTNQCRIKIPTAQTQSNPCSTPPTTPIQPPTVELILAFELSSIRPLH